MNQDKDSSRQSNMAKETHGNEQEELFSYDELSQTNRKKFASLKSVRWLLILFDFLIFTVFDYVTLFVYPGKSLAENIALVSQYLLGLGCIFAARFCARVYRQMWRYGGMTAYMRLILADFFGGAAYYFIQKVALKASVRITFFVAVSIVSIDLLFALIIRFAYHFFYRHAKFNTVFGKFSRLMLLLFAGIHSSPEERQLNDKHRIKVAIVGAGRVGVSLAEELINNPKADYLPCCFIDANPEKAGRRVYGIPILLSGGISAELLSRYAVQEVVFALPQSDEEKKKELYDFYKKLGYKIKVYDFPTLQSAGMSKRHLREFEIEELLSRRTVEFSDEKTTSYYRDKVILITGGGGSIGSEIARQIAKMSPKQLILLDICENSVYDIQQELKIAYGDAMNLSVEIVSVCDRKGLEKVFAAYRPHVILHAAAHKHVPLMEHNCCEAIKNNVFGTLNTVELAEAYGAERFIMVSTDKAVNPTNVMGATKRMCEMIVLSHSRGGSKTTYSATRFGNVLGSAGSVIPLFKRQIANGGPIPLTDKRIIRYFMTIPEASQLVLESGAMAKSGELFVLDMGKQVKILELAENMIRLSGYEPYRDIDIVETGLRPGEKLYEELLIRSETLSRTENGLIFVEKDDPITADELNEKLDALRTALLSEDDDTARAALHKAVPTYHTPEEVNKNAEQSREMQEVENAAMAGVSAN